MKRAMKAGHTIGFGAPADISDFHHICVRIPSKRSELVEIIEDWGVCQEPTIRCRLSRGAWDAVAGTLENDFNPRLHAKGLKRSKWKTGDNQVDRILGRELCLLAWTVEQLPPHLYDRAKASWKALRPEERWWLTTRCEVDGGEADDEIVGWRKALPYAMGAVDDAESVAA